MNLLHPILNTEASESLKAEAESQYSSAPELPTLTTSHNF